MRFGSVLGPMIQRNQPPKTARSYPILDHILLKSKFSTILSGTILGILWARLYQRYCYCCYCVRCAFACASGSVGPQFRIQNACSNPLGRIRQPHAQIYNPTGNCCFPLNKSILTATQWHIQYAGLTLS